MEYEILDNAYWEDGIDDRSVVKCIRMHKEKNGGKRKEVATFSKFLPDRSLCPQYKEVVAKVGVEKIDKNTTERRERKAMEQKTGQIKREQKAKAQELERLFSLKLRAFEIPEIRDSELKKLRTKLRRAQNEIEMNAYATLILGIEAGILKEPDNE
jgi:hypothetical protein